MISSHGSNSCLVSSLKTVSFHLFSMFFFPIWSHLEHTHRTKRNPETVKLKPSPHTLNHSLSSLPLPHSFNYISHLCLSPSSLSQLSPDHNSLSQSLSASLTLSLHLCLIAVTLITSLPYRHHSYSIASLPRLQGTISFLILLSFMSIYIF